MSEVHVFTATNANGTSSEFISNKDYLLLKAENAELKRKLDWLVYHSICMGSISKAKGASILGISLIDMKDPEEALKSISEEEDV